MNWSYVLLTALQVERDGATRMTKYLTKRIKECVVRGRIGDGIKERRLG